MVGEEVVVELNWQGAIDRAQQATQTYAVVDAVQKVKELLRAGLLRV